MDHARTEQLRALLEEVNFDAWESVSSALARARGQVPPRVAWLALHLSDTKRVYWRSIAAVTGTPTPAAEGDLAALMRWEVEAVSRLGDEQLDLTASYAGRVLSVAALIRLNARHSAWHAGQIAALSSARTA